jgi:hypothetical protein
VRAAIRIVFNPLDLARDAVLAAFKIYDAIVPFVTTTTMTHTDPALIITAIRLSFCRPGVMTRTWPRLPGDVGFDFCSAITCYP